MTSAASLSASNNIIGQDLPADRHQFRLLTNKPTDYQTFHHKTKNHRPVRGKERKKTHETIEIDLFLICLVWFCCCCCCCFLNSFSSLVFLWWPKVFVIDVVDIIIGLWSFHRSVRVITAEAMDHHRMTSLIAVASMLLVTLPSLTGKTHFTIDRLYYTITTITTTTCVVC